MFFTPKEKTVMPSQEDALPGRPIEMPVPDRHFVLDRPLREPYPDGVEQILFGMGCFWGAERKFWEGATIFTTAVGYAAGFTPNPTYEEVCTGKTGHNEVVLVAYDPAQVSLSDLLKIFWENHDPTQGMRQGNDVGTQYRSGIYTFTDAQNQEAQESKKAFQAALQQSGYGEITTEVLPAGPFFFAEDYHQQYLAKNPNGYCGLGGTGVSCPIGLNV